MGNNAFLLVNNLESRRVGLAGAGDCSSCCVGVMLELARGISQWAHGLKKAVIFLFNTGEKEGFNGAHSFITQEKKRGGGGGGGGGGNIQNQGGNKNNGGKNGGGAPQARNGGGGGNKNGVQAMNNGYQNMGGP
ncbi:uncharacterized protein LOC133315422 [Gastrolobium bilobum]|uniref:uncharacterized protein LOC133315422 n=1 Tax=Gastrolobium bilobum TaxID=150636 RepID=UPI002AB0453F|nr:uncharacterized protein LOC133315422 [Gastrolobium bilobum]